MILAVLIIISIVNINFQQLLTIYTVNTIVYSDVTKKKKKSIVINVNIYMKFLFISFLIHIFYIFLLI